MSKELPHYLTEDLSFNARFKRYLDLYVPYLNSLLYGIASIFSSSPTDEYKNITPENAPLAYALRTERRQNRALNIITLIAVAIAATFTALLILSNPVGWGVATLVLGGIAINLSFPFLVRGMVKAGQALRNKWKTRFNITYVSELTDKKAELLSKKLELNNDQKNDLKAKFYALNSVPKANKKRILTDRELNTIVEIIPATKRNAFKYLLGFTQERISQVREVFGLPSKITIAELTPELAKRLTIQLIRSDIGKKAIYTQFKILENNEFTQNELNQIRDANTLLNKFNVRFGEIKSKKSDHSTFLTEKEFEEIIKDINKPKKWYQRLKFWKSDTYLDLTKKQKKQLKYIMGFTVSDQRLRLLSGGTSPLEDQNIGIHHTTTTAAAASAAIFAVLGTAFSFIFSPIAVIPLSAFLGTLVGAAVGHEIGKGRAQHASVNLHRTFDGLAPDTINVASNWWFKRFIRYVVITVIFIVAHLTGLLTGGITTLWTLFAGYATAGVVSSAVMHGGNKLKTDPYAINEFDPDKINYELKPDNQWGEKEIQAAKTFMMGYYEKYRAKSNLSGLFAAIAHRIYYNIMYPYEKITAYIPLPKNLFLKVLIFIFYTLPFYYVIPFAVSLAMGLPKSILEGVAQLPVFNYIVNLAFPSANSSYSKMEQPTTALGKFGLFLRKLFSFGENSYTQLHTKHEMKMENVRKNLYIIADYEANPTPGNLQRIINAIKPYVQRKHDKAVFKKEPKQIKEESSETLASSVSAASLQKVEAPVPEKITFGQSVNKYLTGDTFAIQQKTEEAPPPSLQSLLIATPA